MPARIISRTFFTIRLHVHIYLYIWHWLISLASSSLHFYASWARGCRVCEYDSVQQFCVLESTHPLVDSVLLVEYIWWQFWHSIHRVSHLGPLWQCCFVHQRIDSDKLQNVKKEMADKVHSSYSGQYENNKNIFNTNS